MWKQLGIRTTIRSLEWAQFLDHLGPPPDSDMDTFALGWIGDFPDAINFLEILRCDSGQNKTNSCDPRYDRLLDAAVSAESDATRFGLYGDAEALLTGVDGRMPLIPLYWSVYPILHKKSVVGWKPNALDQFDWTAVRIEGA